jgi:WD40 repeat protein
MLASDVLRCARAEMDLRRVGRGEMSRRRVQTVRSDHAFGKGARRMMVAALAALIAACSPSPGSTASDPAYDPTPAELGIFADVRGWIAYGNEEGIWAVNPVGGTPPDRVQLSERPGEPIAWSADGSKLLISRETSDAIPNPACARGSACRVIDLDLFVLSADGTETRLTRGRDWGTGSISPDGSKVIYDVTTGPANEGEEWQSGIYVVEADGGEPRLLLASGLQDYPDGTFRTALFRPTFSPDGTQIAYIDGMRDWGNTIRVMNADGSGVRVLVDWSTLPPPPAEEFGQVYGSNLAWSPDGQRLTFNGDGGTWIVGVEGDGLTNLPVGDAEDFVVPGEVDWGGGVRWSPTGSRLAFRFEGIWVINADGSGRRQVASDGHDPVWSPDGSRIAYLDEGSLYVVDQEGTHVRTLGTLEPRGRSTSVAWISASGEEQPTATLGGSGAAPFVYAIAVLGAVGVLVIAWRARRRIATT